ncbi:hypothetical protein SAMN05421848_0060 [Kushneria avicenniae]|uniref:Uncharacterized protein n=1 Tax=Kushneria avicenniae TaxID=402385 RepID=A0A1I1FAR0_9GAMM|nr:hypothetical protein SAMN05421848_0060 [Kushneria avicenniae]
MMTLMMPLRYSRLPMTGPLATKKAPNGRLKQYEQLDNFKTGSIVTGYHRRPKPCNGLTVQLANA